MFLTRLTISDTPRPDFWILAAPLIWSDATFGTLTAPAGFLTDLASIPRALRNLPALDVDGLSRRPAAMHDWLYGSVDGRNHGKDFADTFLRAALEAEGMSELDATLYYEAVRDFGQSSWNTDVAKASGFLPL